MKGSLGLVGLCLALAACAAPTRAVMTGQASGAPTSARLELRWQASLVSDEPWEWRPVEYSQPLYIAQERLVVVGTSEGRLVALDADTGQERWSVQTGARVDAPPSCDGEVIVVGNNGGLVTAVNLGGGKLWTAQVRGEVDGPAVFQGDVVVFQDTGDVVHALDRETGKARWTYTRELPDYFTVGGSSWPVISGGRVLAGFSDGVLAALDLADGDLVWGRNLSAGERDFVDVDSISVWDGVVYASSYAGGLYALDANSGEERWHNELKGVSRVVRQGEALYATSSSRYVVSLDAGSGELVWSYRHETGTPTHPALVGDVLLYGAAESSAYATDRRSGAVLLEFDPRAGFNAPVTVEGEDVYLFSNGGTLYAMRLVVP